MGGQTAIIFLITVASQTASVADAFSVSDPSLSVTRPRRRRYGRVCVMSTVTDDVNGMDRSSSSSYPSSVSDVNLGGEVLSRVRNIAQFAQSQPSDTSVNNRDEAEHDFQLSQTSMGMGTGTGGTALLFPSISSYNGLQGGRGGVGQNRELVLNTLETLERDMQMLDDMAGEVPQLTSLEMLLLSMSVAVASSGPIFFPDAFGITKVLAPASAAFSAAIGIGAEYTGKVAVADGKEVAAAAIQCAAEAEGLLAKAERVKAVSPLCVGISATSATFAIVAPVLIETILGLSELTPQLVTELYLLSPLVAVLSAAVASLAFQETQSYCSRAIDVGNRRFAGSNAVGRTWLSTSEQIRKGSSRTRQKWSNFATSVLPAPTFGFLLPGVPLSTRTIVVAAVAAAQTAYFLARSEGTLARATDAVALKARSAAVCDTYANQGARSAAILPFTSALSSLCAAATAAIVELPFTAVIGGGVPVRVALVAFFPTLSSLLSGAASVSKARCEVDSEAAIQAAGTLALEYDGDQEDPILRPVRGVMELVRLSVKASLRKVGMARRYLFGSILGRFQWLRNMGLRSDNEAMGQEDDYQFKPSL